MVSYKLWSLIANHLRSKMKKKQTNIVKYVLDVDSSFQASTNELKQAPGILIHNFFHQKGRANQYLISTPDLG